MGSDDYYPKALATENIMFKKRVFTSLILIATATPTMAITRIKCFSPVHQVTIDGRTSYPIVSPRDCICTDKGIYCRSGSKPIKNTNLMANCQELNGKYDGKYCVMPSGDWKEILLIEKEAN